MSAVRRVRGKFWKPRAKERTETQGSEQVDLSQSTRASTATSILPHLRQLDPMVKEFLGSTPMDAQTRKYFLATPPVVQLYVVAHWRPKRGYQEGNYSGLVRSLVEKAKIQVEIDPLTAVVAEEHDEVEGAQRKVEVFPVGR